MNTRTTSKISAVHGVLALDKPKGPTSFDLVARVRRAYRTKSVGHAGTLDPMATGVLVVMLGEATKLSEHLTAQDKEYVAEVTFGRSTDTLDATGTTTESDPSAVDAVTFEAVERVLAEERARQWQLPPEHSAIKVAGQRAYALARRGEAFELPLRSVCVKTLAVSAFTHGVLTLRMRVSKGYYVRSLVRDVCASLGVPGCMSALRRTASGAFRLEDCATLSSDPEALPPALLSITEAVKRSLAWATLTPEGVTRARQGKRLETQHFDAPPATGITAWLSPEHTLIALGERVAESQATGNFRVVRGFNPELT